MTETENILGRKSREELLNLLIELADRFQDVRQHILDNEQLTGGRVDELVDTLKGEIRDLTTDSPWFDPSSGEGSLPDFSYLQYHLHALFDRGYTDEVLELGEELWSRAGNLVGEFDDYGIMNMASCMGIVLEALPRSSLSPPEQMLWAIDRMVEDDYSMLDDARELIRRRTYTRDHWREVSDILEERLRTTPPPGDPDSSTRYRRQELLEWLLDCYKRAGWTNRIIPRLEEEADTCLCYTELVSALLKARRREQAREWCIHGYKKTRDNAWGIASNLQERLRTMADQEGRYDMAAAYRAKDFFDQPSSVSFEKLCKAAEKAGCRPPVRNAALAYLETGGQPELKNWPLPAPEVDVPTAERRKSWRQFPDIDTLIDIAIMEKRFDDVVSLYGRRNKKKQLFREIDKKTAKAVAETHPDIALTIWRSIVDDLIAQVKPKAYQEAAGYLRFMRKVYMNNGLDMKWQELLNELRITHKAKRRLMEVLDRLSRKKTR